MPLYTFVLDFDGGTYIAQIEAPSFQAAPAIWANTLSPGVIHGMREASIRELRKELAEKEPDLLDGLTHAWCTTALVRGRLALINFVQTCGQDVMANQSLEPTRVDQPPLAAQLQRYASNEH